MKTSFSSNNDRVDHDTYGARLNGSSQTTMGSIKNEDVFMFPRPPKTGDTLIVRGNIYNNSDKFFFKLKNGTPSQLNNSFTLQIEFDYSKDNIELKTHTGEEANAILSSIIKNGDFMLKLQIRDYDEDVVLVDVNILEHIFESVSLDRNVLQNVTFFTFTNGVMEINELTFRYA